MCVPRLGGRDTQSETADDETLDDAQKLLFEPAVPLQPPPPPPSRHPWAWLRRRVLDVDIMTCPQCQGAMRVKTIATGASDIQAVLASAPDRRDIIASTG